MTTNSKLSEIRAELAKIAKAREAATQGEWRPYHTNCGTHYVGYGPGDKYADFRNRICEYSFRYSENQCHTDMDFIALSANKIAGLVEALDTAVEVLEFYAQATPNISRAVLPEQGSAYWLEKDNEPGVTIIRQYPAKETLSAIHKLLVGGDNE